MTKDEARKTHRDLKGQTLSNWDLLLNAMEERAVKVFIKGRNHLLCLRTGGIGHKGETRVT